MRTIKRRYPAVLLAVFVSGIYVAYLPTVLSAGDTGDFLSAIATCGIAHPPGYPLYTSLGILLSLIPAGSLVTNVALLSVFPAAASIAVLYELLSLLTGKRAASFIAALSLVFVYPFWLYSETVEVFSLNSFFTVLLLLLMVQWHQNGRARSLLLASFVLGLSLSHHLIILFLLPCLLYLLVLRPVRRRLLAVACFGLVLAGLLPYVYLPTAARADPQLNWMGPPTVANMITLISRRGYGTFRSAQQIGHQPVLRAANLYAFADLWVKDFRLFGCALIVAGCWYLARRQRMTLVFILIAAGSYLFFLFYASFPLMSDFLVGTFERFVLPIYLVLVIPLAFGMIQLCRWIAAVSALLPIRADLRRRLPLLITLVLVLYPVGLFLLNRPAIYALQTDTSVERLGEDVLAGAPENSIVILSMDTMLFSTQYMYFGQGLRRDVKLIHFTKLYQPLHRNAILRRFPDVFLPQSYESTNTFLLEFMEKNAQTAPILSSIPLALDRGQWVPWGLLYRYVSGQDGLSVEEIAQENSRLWSIYQPPWDQQSWRVKPLLSADVARIYAQARTETGYFLAAKGKSDEARAHLLGALQWDPENPDALLTLGQVYVAQKQCDAAQQQFTKRMHLNPDDPATYYALYLTYTQCFTDAKKAKEYHQLYELKTKQSETKLKEL